MNTGRGATVGRAADRSARSPYQIDTAGI